MSQHSSTDESEEELLESDEEEETLSSSSSRSPSLSPAPSSSFSRPKRRIATVSPPSGPRIDSDEDDEFEDRGLAVSIKRKKVSIPKGSFYDGDDIESESPPTRPSVIRAGTVAATNLQPASDILGEQTKDGHKPVKRRVIIRSSTISGTSQRTVLNSQPLPVKVGKSMYSTTSTTTTKAEEPPSRLLRHRQIHNIRLEIRMGDLTDETSEAIVNAANGRLAHGGGVAGAISRAGGRTIQDESDDWTRNYGDVITGNVAYTSAGYLPAKYVIHAVGPIWSRSSSSRCENELRLAVANSLKCADELGLKSISIPAISSGIFGFPKDLCGEIMLEEVRKYADALDAPTTSSTTSASSTTSTTPTTSTSPKKTLETIRLVNFDDVTCTIFCKEFDRQLGQSPPSSPPSSPPKKKRFSFW